MKTTFKRALALLLSMLMVFSVCNTALIANAVEDWPAADSTIDYVSFGASNTNGYGHRGYLPLEVTEDPLAASKAELNVYGYGCAPENAYPAKIKNALELSTGKTVNLHQLAISSMRTEELRVLLDNEYYGDAYTEWRFTGGQKWFEIALDGGMESLRDAYQAAVRDAELITVDIGWNNFGVYAFNNIKVILTDGRYWKAPQFDDVLTADQQLEYDNIKKLALDYLNSNVVTVDPSLQAKLEMIADVLAYATIGACYHFDVVIEKIYELNPDATVVSLNIQNLADGLVVNFEGVELKLGDLYGKLIEMTDLYRAYSSPYADTYLFADAGDISTFLDEIVAWDGDPTTITNDMKDCFDMYDDGLYVRSIIEYLMVGQTLSGVFKTFRDMAAEYGLPLFTDSSANAEDAKGYIYEFGLTRSAGELLSLDLSNLDFSNPSGTDADVEYYGAAVAAHLKNLRAQNYSAYDYVFEQLNAVLNAQKVALMANAADNAAAIAQIDAALTSVIPTAQAQFKGALMSIYVTYQNTLNYAYDIIATFVQYAAKHNTIALSSDSLSNFGAAADILMSTLLNDFLTGAQTKFYYELNKNGIQNTGVTVDPVYALDESIFADPAVLAGAVLAVRYELGNSFYAHPNTVGFEQITTAVLEALEKAATASDYFDKELVEALDWLMDYAKENYPELVLPITNIIESEEFADLCEQIEAIYAQYQAANPEQKEALAPRIYALLLRFNTIAAMTTSKKLEDVNYYVSIGDSTLAGYGLDEYVPGMNNGEGQVIGVEAPVLLAQKLFGEDYASHFTKLDKGGIRIEDLLVWLGEDEFIDDFYIRYTMDDNAVVKNTEYYQNLYISEIEKADLITLAIGGGNVTAFVSQQVQALARGDEPYEMDWSKYYPETDMTEIRNMIATMQDILKGQLPAVAGVPGEVLAPVVAESLLYGLIVYKENFTKVLDRIHEINPNAHLVIVGYFNPIDNMVIPFGVGNKVIEIPFGTMIGLFMEVCNIKSLVYTLENKANTTFVAIPETTSILDEQGKFDLASQINGTVKETWLTHAGPKGHEYIANQIYTSITTDYASGEMVLPPVDYNITAKSSYVALGDNKEYTEAFANYLKACVAAEGVKYEYKTNTDLIVENSSINTLAGIVAENIDVIATADLISIGYSLDKVAENTMRIVLELLIEGQTEVPTTFDWVALVGEYLAETLTGALADIHATLIEQGLGVPMSEMVGGMIQFPDVSIADAAMKAIEYFAYNAVEYAVYMPKAVQLISAINPNATIMVNTLSNPMAGAKMSIMGMELEFGDYLDYLTDLIFYESALITVMNEKVVLVPANRVETTFTNYVISLNPGTSLFKDFMALTKLIAGLKAGDLIKTTANGNAYVLAKMMSALNISVEPPIRGDFNSDGSVTVADSVYLMVSLANPEKYSLNQSGDLNGDGKVDRADTTYLTRFLVSPAEYPLK